MIINKNAFQLKANRLLILTLPWSNDFGTQTDLDMVLIYHCAKKKVSIPSASKVKA